MKGNRMEKREQKVIAVGNAIDSLSLVRLILSELKEDGYFPVGIDGVDQDVKQ